jgi:hypothetical protein
MIAYATGGIFAWCTQHNSRKLKSAFLYLYLKAFVVHTEYKWTIISLNQRDVQNDVTLLAVIDHVPWPHHDILDEAPMLDVNSL